MCEGLVHSYTAVRDGDGCRVRMHYNSIDIQTTVEYATERMVHDGRGKANRVTNRDGQANPDREQTGDSRLETSETPSPDVASERQNRQSQHHGRDSAERSARASHTHDSEKKKRRPNFITRTVNGWYNRLLGAVSEGSLSDQEEAYAAHRTSRDYVWNTIGFSVWGMVFPLLTIVVTQLVGVEQAGMFSFAFVTGMLLMIVANYGVRTYQVSDVSEVHSFSDYQANRWITCTIMVLIGIGYCIIRGYDQQMFAISVGVYLYKMIDGLADVYEGRLQQMDKLYLAGISQAFRSLMVFVVFSICLFITHDLGISSIAMAAAAAVSFIILTFPLALLETPKSRRWTTGSVNSLFKQCFPLFIALFLYALIDNMPKFVMEGVLSYDNQLYFNALYFPAQAILLIIGFIYRPLLVRMANVWADPSKHRRFDLIIVMVLITVVGVTVVAALIMGWIGIPIMSFLYGVDFEQFRGLAYIMLAAGGVTAAIDFLYQVITVLRQQRAVTKLYLITFGFSLFVSILLVNFTGLPGAIISYLIVMCILFVLLIWEYLRIRMELSDRLKAEEERSDEERHRRPSEIRAEREFRQHVMEKRTSHRK